MGKGECVCQNGHIPTENNVFRHMMRNIYDNREGLLNEKLSPNAYRNDGVRLRRKISRAKKAFEDRLAAILVNFSTKINVCAATAKEIAEDRILFVIF